MEIQKYIDSKNKLLTHFLSFIDSFETDEQNEFFKSLDDQKFDENLEEFRLFIRLLMIISNYHYRYSGFFKKIEQIILHFENIIKQNYSNYEIYRLFCSNRRIVLFLIEQKIIKMDLEIVNSFYNNCLYLCYFYPEIKDIVSEYMIKGIELFLQYRYKCTFDDFDKKRHEGENDSYICYLIRNDLIVEFVTYTSQANIPLSSKVPISLFETNSFLQDSDTKKYTPLIAYAAFYGSIQIFNYLRINQVEMDYLLWIYAMHSNNADLIHLLEECHVEKNIIFKTNNLYNFYDDYPEVLRNIEMRPFEEHDFLCGDYLYYEKIELNDDNVFEIILENSIKFHNDKFINYIFENHIQDNEKLSKNLFFQCLKYQYYPFFPTDLSDLYDKYIKYLCVFNYFTLTDILMTKLDNINSDEAFEGCVHSYTGKLLQRFIDNGIINIEQLHRCSLVEEITIPSFIEIIQPYTFFECSSLRKIDIPSSVKKIGDGAFKECSSLKTIIIPSSLTRYGAQLFQGCESLESIDIRCSLLTILDSMFFGCKSLKQITISESVNEICNNAFCQCSSLQQISIPKFVRRIGENAFKGCYSLKHVSFSSSSFLTIIDKSAFMNCGSLVDVKLPKSLSYIGDYAFSGCWSLIEISLPLTLSYIQAYAFSGCASLINIEIPPLIKRINFGLFKGCTSLTNVTIPQSVVEIEAASFKDCPLIKKEVFPSTVVYIDEFVFGRDQ